MIGKAHGPTEAYEVMILASGDVGIGALMEPCQRILCGEGMPANWATSVAIPIFRGRGDIMDYCMHTDVKPLEHAVEIVEKVLERNYNDR